MKNAIVGQSGGPTAAINASLAGVIEECLKSNEINILYGAVHGIDGVLNEDLINLTEIFSENEKIELLKVTPASYLGSCRHRINDEDADRVFEVMKKLDIGYFFYIGGNDSMDTVAKLSKTADVHGIKVIGIPKTIDNDLFGTDHCPGYGSAAKYIASSVMEITRDCTCYDLDSVTIVELMGRNAGWLTAASALANCNGNSTPDLIYLPERPFIKERFIEDVKRKISEKGSIVVAVSEGIKNEEGVYISEQHSLDAFGHGQLGGTGECLVSLVKNTLHCKSRAIEINLLQRCAGHMLSKTDIDLSVSIGKSAVTSALAGSSGVMMAFKHVSRNPFSVQIEKVDVSEIANVENRLPEHYINESGNYVTESFIEYATPLISGETSSPMHNGLPLHLIRKG